jgi:hypothetical protein
MGSVGAAEGQKTRVSKSALPAFLGKSKGQMDLERNTAADTGGWQCHFRCTGVM